MFDQRTTLVATNLLRGMVHTQSLNSPRGPQSNKNSNKQVPAWRPEDNCSNIFAGVTSGIAAIGLVRYRRSLCCAKGIRIALRSEFAATDGENKSWRLRLDELRAMRVRPLRAELKALGCNVDRCVDRESTMELLETQGVAALMQADPSTAGSSAGGRKASWQSRLEELRDMRVRPLRAELQALGCNVQSCLDRESLLELLETQGEAALIQEDKNANQIAFEEAKVKNTFEYQKQKAREERDASTINAPTGPIDSEGRRGEYPSWLSGSSAPKAPSTNQRLSGTSPDRLGA